MLAEKGHLLGIEGDPAEHAPGRRGPDIGPGMLGEQVHSGLVAEDGAAGALGRGVDGQDGEAETQLFTKIEPQLLNEGALSGPRRATNAHPEGLVAPIRRLPEQFFHYEVCL